MKDQRLKRRVLKGMFSDDRAIVFTMSNGQRTSEFVPSSKAIGETDQESLIRVKAFEDGKTVWGVSPTDPAIDAGFGGTLALELVNLGPLPILPHPNASIRRLIVEEASGVPFLIENQCQQQSRAGGQRSRRKT